MALFFLGSGFISWFVLPLNSFRLRSLGGTERVRAQQRFLLGIYRLIMWIWEAAGLVGFQRPDLPADLPDGPYIVVANHPSMVDVLMILSTLPNVCCLVKPSWFSSPFIGPLLRHGAHIPGANPDQRAEGTSVLDTIVERLNEGLPVLVFPEGSRSPRYGLRRFKRGAVEAAARAAVPIVPLFLFCSPPALMKGQALWDMPDRRLDLTLDFLPVMDPPRPGEGSRMFTQELKASYDQRVQAACHEVGEGHEAGSEIETGGGR